MIRIEKIIPKDKLWQYIANSDVSRIDIHGSPNRALKDQSACKVLIYAKDTPESERLPEKRMHDIFSAIQKQSKSNLMEGDNQYLRGIMSQKDLGFLKESQIYKLREIQRRNDINLHITKEIIEIINEYKNHE